jgi:fructose-1,6-bisphosphatase I
MPMKHSPSGSHIRDAAAQELENTEPETLSSWILTQQHLRAPEAQGNLTQLLTAIAVGCKFVASAVRKAGLAGMLGMAGSANVQGEDQKKLDILANDVFISLLTRCKQCAVLISEENDEPIIVDEEHRGGYCVTFDPLDGSSNIDCGVSIGTIFGIYPVREGSTGDESDVLRPGREMVAAGYCMYGSSCCLVLSLGQGISSCFTLDPSMGEFILTTSKMEVPPVGKIYSVNEGNAQNWNAPTTDYVQECKFPQDGQKPKSLRYVGSMVADVHRTILYGGSFLYPADAKSKHGKLRLLYEGNPMAFITENAGGLAVSGTTPVLDLQPTHIHERNPIFLGSKTDVERILELHKKHGVTE